MAELWMQGLTIRYTCIWGVSPIILCRASQALSGWMGSVTAQIFSGLSRDPCVVLAVCLGSLSCWKVNLHPQSEVMSALEQVFIKDLSVLCSVHLSLNPDQSPSPYR